MMVHYPLPMELNAKQPQTFWSPSGSVSVSESFFLSGVSFDTDSDTDPDPEQTLWFRFVRVAQRLTQS